MAVKSETKAEAADVMKTVDEDRRLLIQAIIVRIMKSRRVSGDTYSCSITRLVLTMSFAQTMKNQQLIQETITQLSQRFTPKVADIKKAIDTLLDKEYIERVEGNRDTFSYLGETIVKCMLRITADWIAMSRQHDRTA